MKFYCVGDLHGTVPKKPGTIFDAVLCTGDLGDFEKIREWIFKEHSGKFTGPWYDQLGRDKAEELVEKTVKSARRVIKKIDSWGVPVVIVPGNADLYGGRFMNPVDKQSPFYWEYYFENHFSRIIKNCKKVVNLELKRGLFKGFTIIGYGVSSGPEGVLTRKGIVLDAGYQKIIEKLEAFMQMSDPKKTILLSHNVPNQTRLDKIKDKKSDFYGEHLGSNIVRYLVEKYQPLASVGGHIHDGQGREKIRGTLCLNAGYGAEGQAVFLELNGKPEARFLK